MSQIAKQQSNEISLINDETLISHLDNIGLTSKLSKGEKDTFLQIAKAFNLNPFKREIHVSKYGEQMSIITGYEVYIKRAERSGLLDGWKCITSGSIKEGNLKALLTIYRKDRNHPFEWEAHYSEFVQTTRDGKVTKFWEKAEFMTKKVAIAQGFRLCFSDELGGMPYTQDELPDLSQQTIDVPIEVIEVDYNDALESCNSMEELKSAWKAIPAKDKPNYEAKKEEIKNKLNSLELSINE